MTQQIELASSVKAFQEEENYILNLKFQQLHKSQTDDRIVRTLSQDEVFQQERQISKTYRFYGKIEFVNFDSVIGEYYIPYRDEPNDLVPCVRTVDTLDYQQSSLNIVPNVDNWGVYIAYPFSSTTYQTVSSDSVVNFIHYKTLTKDGDVLIRPYNLSKNFYGDPLYNFICEKDIDITGLKDYLNRPVTELTILFVYKNSINGQFLNFIVGPNLFPANIWNPSFDTFFITKNYSINALDFTQTGVTIEFVNAKVLDKINYTESAYGKPNTYVSDAIINDNNCSNVPTFDPTELIANTYPMGSALEILKFSNTLNVQSASTFDNQIPDYAFENDGFYRWRNILDIGTIEFGQNGVDYPFLNGCHYFFNNSVKFKSTVANMFVEKLFDNVAYVPDLAGSFIGGIGGKC